MRKLLTSLGAVVLVVSFAGVSLSHIGTTIYVQQVDPAKITIDGLNDDWLAAGYEETFTLDVIT
ncbi:MAG: hypothetical protein KAV99_03515 [Candidatus Latescibacteria bacterium]|nr:hypothetical protein [Candidatus Latescibacterota bacterium]